MNKKILIPVIIVLAVIGIVLFGRFGMKLGEWEYDSYEEFRSKGEDYYPKWFLMKVGDAHDPDYSLDDFPVHLAFDKVGAGDIRDYVIIQYSPVGTGTSGHGLVANPDTGRIVIYREGHIR